MQISRSKLACLTRAGGLAGSMATAMATAVAAPRPGLAQASLRAPTHSWSFDGDNPASMLPAPDSSARRPLPTPVPGQRNFFRALSRPLEPCRQNWVGPRRRCRAS